MGDKTGTVGAESVSERAEDGTVRGEKAGGGRTAGAGEGTDASQTPEGGDRGRRFGHEHEPADAVTPPWRHRRVRTSVLQTDSVRSTGPAIGVQFVFRILSKLNMGQTYAMSFVLH